MDVHNVLKYEWPNTIREDSNPIEMAVQLLDDSSVGLAHKIPEFDKVKQETDTVLRLAVNDQNEVFNKAIGSYHLLVRNLDESLKECEDIKELLETVTKDIHDKSDKLTELNEQSKRYADMLEILDAIDELNGVPQKVEHLIQERRLNNVYDVISNSYKIAEQYNLWTIPVLGTIKSYLETQSNNLFDMIIDELQNELFLKNENDNDEFSRKNLLNSKNPKMATLKSLISDSQNLESFIYNSANIDYMEIADLFNSDFDYFLNTQLPKLHERCLVLEKIGGSSGTAEDFTLLFDATKNDDFRSYHYMYHLLQTASKLSRLPQIVEILVGNIQLEMHSVIRNLTAEVKGYNLVNITKMNKFNLLDRTPKVNDPFGMNSFHDFAVIILEDLFSSLFLKLGRVLQRHKILSKILELLDFNPINSEFARNVRPMTSSEGDIPSINSAGYVFSLAWSIIRKEIQSLLNNYIYDLNYVQPGMNEALPNLKSKGSLYKILRTKDVFKFESHNLKNQNKLRSLEDMFSGYTLSDDVQSDFTANNKSPYIMSETYNAHVEMLTPLSVFNMRIILEFFLIFVATSKAMVVENSPIQFFKDFMEVTFMSYLNQKIDNEFNERVANTRLTEFSFKNELLSLDSGRATVADYNAKASLNPEIRVIYKNAMDFKNTLSNICAIFNTAVIYRSSYNGAALGTIQSFAQTYVRHFENLICALSLPISQNNVVCLIDSFDDASNGVPEFELKLWLHIPALVEVSNTLLKIVHQQDTTPDQYQEWITKEIEIMTTDRNLRLFDISSDDFLDDETFHQVCYLYLSSTWVLSWLPNIKREAFKPSTNTTEDSLSISEIEDLKNEWSFLESGRFEHSGRNHINDSAFTGTDKEISIANGNGKTSTTNTQVASSILLALDHAHGERFDDYVGTLKKVQNEALLTLRYDIRLRCVYYICRSFKSVDWFPTAEPGDADQFISKLSKEIFHLDNKLSELGILNKEIDLYLGLSEILDVLMIKGSRLIKKINLFGIKRVLLNIISLQQLLRNSVLNPEAVDFSRSSRYYEMFPINEHDLMQQMKTNEYGYDKEEYKNLARMIYSSKLADGDGPAFTKTKYNDLLKYIDDNVS
ncbi:uncharacterized protein KQ657_005060 [Scheffersomyces spartinae]|uniref:Exocyst complex component Sec8 n=1 Tax=Scheffersomyces spartinae TaxID=45513 RepID=A0A9P8AJ70_9ASCO|nr:uncharacterized protein KQ657_005060 [Scheffersomyces spartinae]KAG7193862.1 hypothetical protein KQ657_005060 [Scheffersomyces spartinae]